MKYPLTVILLAVLIGCQPDNNTGGDTSENIENPNVPATYITDACSEQKTIDDKRTCGDEQLLLEIDDIIFKLEIESTELKSTKLVIEYMINEKGRVASSGILNSVHPEIDKAVLTHITNSRWTPSEFEGRKMKVKRRLPIYL